MAKPLKKKAVIKKKSAAKKKLAASAPQSSKPTKGASKKQPKKPSVQSVPSSTGKKRKAKRVSPVQTQRKPNSYNVIQSAISDYCVKKYGRKCNKKEISEIYSGLKSRYLGKESKTQLGPSEIAAEIDKKLAYSDLKRMPLVLKDFLWYDVVTILKGNDGFFFRPDDMLKFDFMGIGNGDMGVMTTPYNYLEDYYKDDMYPKVLETFSEIYDMTGIKVSPPPTFIFNESKSDYEKRIFVWDMDIDDANRATQKLENRGEENQLTQEDIEAGRQQAAREQKESRTADQEIELAKERRMLEEAKSKTLEEKRKLIEQYRELYKDDIITKEELRDMIKNLDK